MQSPYITKNYLKRGSVMFEFKRYDGFIGSVPQKFIDSNFPKCPMCGTNEHIGN